PETGKIAREVARLEHEGYVFEDAEASLELLIRRMMRQYRRPFQLHEFRTSVYKRGPEGEPQTEATLKLLVEGERTHTVADGRAPRGAPARRSWRRARDRALRGDRGWARA